MSLVLGEGQSQSGWEDVEAKVKSSVVCVLVDWSSTDKPSQVTTLVDWIG